MSEAVEIGGYDKEMTLDAARVELQDRLLDVEVEEGTPEEFREMVRLEAFAATVADPQVERHLLKAANVELNELLDATPHGIVEAYRRYKLEKQIYGAPLQQAA